MCVCGVVVRERLLGGVRDLLAGVCEGCGVKRRDRRVGGGGGGAAVVRSCDRRRRRRPSTRVARGGSGASAIGRARPHAHAGRRVASGMPMRRAAGTRPARGREGEGGDDRTIKSSRNAKRTWMVAEGWQEEAGGEFGVRRRAARGRIRGRTDGSTRAFAWWTVKSCALSRKSAEFAGSRSGQASTHAIGAPRSAPHFRASAPVCAPTRPRTLVIVQYPSNRRSDACAPRHRAPGRLS